MYENHTWKALLTTFLVVLWGAALYFNEIPLGLDLQGGNELIYQLRDPDSPNRMIQAKEADDTVKVLQKRIDTLGIKELVIRRLGVDKVVIQVPGATDAQTKKIESQIERSGRLQFKILVTDFSGDELKEKVASVLNAKRFGTWNSENAIYDTAELADAKDSAAQYAYTDPDGRKWALLYHRTASGKELYVEGNLLADANRGMDPNGRVCVSFTWGAKGAKRFFKMTSENVNKYLAVVLDGKLESAPTIRQAIGKSGIIEMYDDKLDKNQNDVHINSLVVILKAGSLPAKPVKAYSKKVGAQLGAKAVRLGSFSIGLALLVIIVFMAVYYHLKSGLVADVALALNLFLILGTLSMFGATLTLPGIAGILLTAGMAVDANILIFERIREEIAGGSKLKVAVQSGYDRAFWTIFDANLTTALTALVLMWIGTGPIKGFGLTLTIGIVVSMFTALFVTRFIYGFLVAKEVITEVKFMQLFERPNIDFFGANKKALTCSLALIVVGWLVFLARGEKKFGIDFTGGTVISMRFHKPLTVEEVTKRIEDHFSKLGEKSVQVEVQRLGEAIDGNKSFEWQIRTHRVEDAPAASGETKTSALMDALLPAAFGQEGGEAPVESAGQGEAPVGSAAPGGEAPVTSGAPAGPAGPAGPAQPAPAPAAPVPGSRNQDYFSGEIQRIFADDLVTAYPLTEGQAIQRVPAAGNLVQARFTANLISLETGADAPKLDANTVKTQLPSALTRLSNNLVAKDAQERILHLKRLAGADGAPGFEVTLAADPDANDGLTPVVFTTTPIPDSQVVEVVEIFQEGLEQAQRHGATFAVAIPFPNVDTVGAAVAKNLSSKALLATMACVVIICLYVWLRFDLWSGIAAIAAVFHDVLALLGFLAILDWALEATGVAFDVKFNLTTISAFLTLVGYSINDTIVILDRIREDKAYHKAKDYTPELINAAINKTMSRTVLTSVTSFLVCLVLFGASFGGLQSIQGLSVALLFGIAVGTYSSMFVAAPILLHDKKKVSIALYGGLGFLLTTTLINAGKVLPALGVIAVMVALPLVLAKIGAFQVAAQPAKKKK